MLDSLFADMEQDLAEGPGMSILEQPGVTPSLARHSLKAPAHSGRRRRGDTSATPTSSRLMAWAIRQFGFQCLGAVGSSSVSESIVDWRLPRPWWLGIPCAARLGLMSVTFDGPADLGRAFLLEMKTNGWIPPEPDRIPRVLVADARCADGDGDDLLGATCPGGSGGWRVAGPTPQAMLVSGGGGGAISRRRSPLRA